MSEQFTIQINGSGTLEEIKQALRELAESLKDEGEYEDNILMTYLEEGSNNEEED